MIKKTYSNLNITKRLSYAPTLLCTVADTLLCCCVQAFLHKASLKVSPRARLNFNYCNYYDAYLTKAFLSKLTGKNNLK